MRQANTAVLTNEAMLANESMLANQAVLSIEVMLANQSMLANEAMLVNEAMFATCTIIEAMNRPFVIMMLIRDADDPDGCMTTSKQN